VPVLQGDGALLIGDDGTAEPAFRVLDDQAVFNCHLRRVG
jgi:hypothetical protein